MYCEFGEINAYVYHSARGVLLDLVIWCLGPYVNDARAYGSPRRCLARVTRSVVRRCVRVEKGT